MGEVWMISSLRSLVDPSILLSKSLDGKYAGVNQTLVEKSMKLKAIRGFKSLVFPNAHNLQVRIGKPYPAA